MKLDVLIFAAHPDDAELSCGGTIASLVAAGKKVGIVDLSRGEMGTRGTAEIRDQEAAKAAGILGLTVRDNLGFQDVFFQIDDAHTIEIVKKIRQYQPDVILANATRDRHPDHSKGAELVKRAVFWSGLKKLITTQNGETQAIWRPRNLYHYIQTDFIEPDFVVDVSAFWDTKMDAIRAFASQFFDANGEPSNTLISSPAFIKLIEARAREHGMSIRVEFGEGFTADRKVGVSDLMSLR